MWNCDAVTALLLAALAAVVVGAVAGKVWSDDK